MSRFTRRGLVGVAVAFLAFHLPYLPASLEDVDSINFALGVRSFDVTRHQPHPPGYPLFVLAGKVAHRFIPSEAQALSAVGIAAGTAGVFALFALYRRLEDLGEPDTSGLWPFMATLAAMTAPLYWFTAERPLSDATGLVAALAVQALVLARGQLVLASFLAGLSVGIRSQAMWLTFPLLVAAVVTSPRRGRMRASGACLTALVAGLVVWAVPLVIVTGGPLAYWRALSTQGAEDLSGIQMLWTTPTLRELAAAFDYAFVAPWARPDVATVVLSLAVIGIAKMWRDRRATLAAIGIAFGPYLLFDLLFQETFTTRYALPLIVPTAYLAVRGASAFGGRLGVALVVALAAFDAHVAGTSLSVYASRPAPAFRLLDDMSAGGVGSSAVVLAPDRRQAFDLRRPMQWAGANVTKGATQLASPPKHEWLEAVKYWNGGGRLPVWFVVDPTRAQMELVAHGAPVQYRWSLPYPALLGGVRPRDIDWYRVDRPEWYVGEGWALSPESAGIAAEDRVGPGFAPIRGWIRRRVEASTMVVGGRNLGSASSGSSDARVTLALDGLPIAEWVVPAGFFLRTIDLPPAAGDGYSVLEISASSRDVAVEQFDMAARDRVAFAYGDGWLEQEFNPTSGERWRWLGQQATLSVFADGRALVMHIEGDSPRKYYPRASRLVVRAGDRVLFNRELSADFSLDIPIASGVLGADHSALTFSTDQTFVPAERSRRSVDRRRLGLRILTCRVTPAS